MQHVPRNWSAEGTDKKEEKVRADMVDYTNSQISSLIDEHIHHALHRKMLKDRFIDGMTYEQIAEKHDITARQTKNIIYKSMDRLIKYL